MAVAEDCAKEVEYAEKVKLMEEALQTSLPPGDFEFDCRDGPVMYKPDKELAIEVDVAYLQKTIKQNSEWQDDKSCIIRLSGGILSSNILQSQYTRVRQRVRSESDEDDCYTAYKGW